jgi:hypothetical protein
VACGGSSSTTSPSGSTTSTAAGTLTFKVDGGSTITSTGPVATLQNGILSIGGGISGDILGMALTPTSAGTGTYTFSPTSPSNATLSVGNPAQGFQAGVGFGSGSIVITSLTSTSVAGTFSFTMTAVGGTATKSVTNGVFNLTLTTAAPLPTTQSDSVMSATVDGVAWTSSVTRRATLLNNFMTLTGQDTNGRVITLVIPFTQTALIPPLPSMVFSLNNGSANQPTVSMVLGVFNWDNLHAGATGSLTITGVTSTRVTGTFQVGLINFQLGTAPSQPNSNITNGKFDMSLERF